MEDLRGADRDIWIHDLALGGDRSITGAGDQNSPASSGSRAAYVDNGAGGAIVVFDADTSSTTSIYPSGIQPDIDGSHVAFVALDGPDLDVRVHDVTGASLAVLTLAGTQVNPHISGDWVAFEDDNGAAPHVALWHWTTGEVFYPAPSASQQTLNDISGNRVVYTDNRNGNLDIFAYDFTYTLPTDTTPPTLTVPDAIVTKATSPAGAVVTYVATASDDHDPNPTVTCSPASGSTFAIGATVVTCTATDAAGNTSTKSFQVFVEGAADQIRDLIDMVSRFNLKQGIANSLDAKLANAEQALLAARAGATGTACNLMAALINEAQAQRDNLLTKGQADQLIAAANQIQVVLGCP